jgi:hypothetical protein
MNKSRYSFSSFTSELTDKFFSLFEKISSFAWEAMDDINRKKWSDIKWSEALGAGGAGGGFIGLIGGIVSGNLLGSVAGSLLIPGLTAWGGEPNWLRH